MSPDIVNFISKLEFNPDDTDRFKALLVLKLALQALEDIEPSNNWEGSRASRTLEEITTVITGV